MTHELRQDFAAEAQMPSGPKIDPPRKWPVPLAVRLGPILTLGESRAPGPVEWTVVVFVLVAAHAVLFARGLPLPHPDLPFYTEPAAMLAERHLIAAPGMQVHDLTYVRAFYPYPPGYTLALALWFELFGVGLRAVLGYTACVHVVYLGLLWGFLRRVVGTAIVPAAVVALSAAPLFSCGRPDVTALAWAALALNLMPRFDRWSTAILAAVCLGLSLLTSPAFGISSTLFTLAAYVARRPDRRWSRPLGRAAGLGVVAGTVAVAGWFATTAWQGQTSLSLVQFHTNAATRGRDLNYLPSLRSGYAVLYFLVPFAFAVVVPTLLVLIRRRRAGIAGPLAVAYWVGAVVWLAINRSQFVFTNHAHYVGQKGLLGGACRSGSPTLRWAGLVGAIVAGLTATWHEKDLVLAASDVGTAAGDWRPRFDALLRDHPTAVVAADGANFLDVYRPYRTLGYEEVRINFWRRSAAVTPASVLAAGPAQPLVADVVLLTRLTDARIPDPMFAGYTPIYTPPGSPTNARVGGVRMPLPQRPMETTIWVRDGLLSPAERDRLAAGDRR